jgi:hypothetical protein
MGSLRRRVPDVARALAAIVLVTGCRKEQERPQVSADPITSSSASVAPKVPRALLDWLATAQVDDRNFAVSTLYTWTTVEQIDALEKGGALLDRSSSPIGTSIYEVDLVHCTEGPIARRLRSDAFARIRFAWTAGWPTVLGLAGRGYGSHLLRVHLKPDAVVARLERDAPLRFHDLAQHDVSEADVDAHPERLAAVLHVHTSVPGVEVPYREFVIVNESMIEEWSYGTPEIAAILEADRKNLLDLRPRLASTKPQDVAAIWRDGAPPDDLAARYLGALAFANADYTPATLPWDALGAALVPPPDERAPIRVAPTVTWPPPPLPKPKPTGPLKPTTW